MSLIATFLGAAVFQMLFLLGTSRLLGPSEYTSYSLIMVTATFATTIIFEPVRMILVRYAGLIRRRVRISLLTTIRRWTEVLVLIVVVTTASVATVCLLAGARGPAGVAAAFGIAIAANGLNDSVASYLRFASDERSYIRFILARAVSSGVAMLGSATLFRSGPVVLIVYSLCLLAIGFTFRAHSWPNDHARVRHHLTLRFWKYGVSLALNSIGVNFAFAASRAALKVIFNKDEVGTIFLALDLATRGVSVLGQAISTWSARPVFDAMHRLGEHGATVAFRRSSSIFLGVWGSMAVYGGAFSLVVPLLVLHVLPAQSYLIVSVFNILALLVISLKLYCADILLSAVDRAQEVAYSAAVFAAVVGLGALSVYVRPSFLAAFSLPIGAFAATAFYWVRNARLFARGVARNDAIYVAFKLAWLVGAVLCTGRSIWLSAIVVLFAASADLLWIYGYYASRSAAAVR